MAPQDIISITFYVACSKYHVSWGNFKISIQCGVHNTYYMIHGTVKQNPAFGRILFYFSPRSI